MPPLPGAARLRLSATLERASATRLSVRLLDVAGGDGQGKPLDLVRYVDEAHAVVRAQYPAFIHRVVRDAGLLEIHAWAGSIAAYWLAPLSEKSPFRTPLIEDLYHLALIDAAVREHAPEELVVTTDDDALFRAVESLGQQAGVHVARAGGLAAASSPAMSRAPVRRVGPWLRLLGRARRAGATVALIARRRAGLVREQWKTWRALRGQADDVLAAGTRSPRPLVALYTRFPVLWDFAGDAPRERNFGTLPAFLASQGYDTVYAAVLSRPLSAAEAPGVREEARRLRVVFLESLLSWREFVLAYLDLGVLWRYLRWRVGPGRRVEARFAGWDVGALVLRACDRDFLGGVEIVTNLMKAHALRRFSRCYRPRAVFHPFEYQPMERALYAGVKSGAPEATVVGLQTGMLSSNRASWFYADGEVSMPGRLPARTAAPFPDFLAVYGHLAHAVFARQCPPDRILLSGPIRYPGLWAKAAAPEAAEDTDRAGILVLGGPLAGETRALLEAAVAVARQWPALSLIVKFHQHNAMHREWADIAQREGGTRYELFEGDVTAVMPRCRVVLLPSSSTSAAVEAMAHGVMPVVLAEPVRYNVGPVADMQDGVFVCGDARALADAVRESLEETAGARMRRKTWPDVLERMAAPLDDKQNDRLVAALQARGAL